MFCISVLLTVRCGVDLEYHGLGIYIIYSISGIGFMVAGIGAQQ